MTTALDANRGADLPITYEFPSGTNLDGFTGAFIIYDARNGDPLLTLSGTPNANDSVIAITDNLVTVFVSKVDITALPVDAEDETSPSILAFDVRITGEDVTTKIHGGVFRVWPFGAKVPSSSGDLTVSLDGIVYDVEILVTGFDATVAALTKQYRDEAEQFAIETQQGLSLKADKSERILLSEYDSLADADSAAQLANKPITLDGVNIIVDLDTEVLSDLIGSWDDVNIFIETGVTLTFSGDYPLDYNPQIFSGGGDVRGLYFSRPDWFGAIADGETDCSEATQKAVDALTASNPVRRIYRPTLAFGSGSYAFANQVDISVTALRSINIVGAGILLDGTRIIRLSGFTGDTAISGIFAIEGSDDSILQITDFQISGLSFQTEVAGDGVGISFNANQVNSLRAVSESLIENCLFNQFRHGMYFSRTRLINFQRCGFYFAEVTSGLVTGIYIRDSVSGSGSFSGDMTFGSCQFQGYASNSSSTGIRMEGRTTGSTISGIRAEDCIFYSLPRGYHLIAQNNANAGNFWVTKCQFDTVAGVAVLVEQFGATSTDVIADVRVKDCYFTAVPANCVRLVAEKAGGINSVQITGNWSAGVTLAAVDSSKANNVTIALNQWTGCSWDDVNGAAINIADCNTLVCTGNAFGQGGDALAGGFYHMVRISGASDYLTVRQNNSAGLASNALVQNDTTVMSPVTSIGDNI